MTNNEKIEKAIKDYCPTFEISKIEFVRSDTSTFIYDIYGEMTKPGMFSVYPFHSIKPVIDGHAVLYYRVIIDINFFVN
jgi:hypothetical protein